MPFCYKYYYANYKGMGYRPTICIEFRGVEAVAEMGNDTFIMALFYEKRLQKFFTRKELKENDWKG